MQYNATAAAGELSALPQTPSLGLRGRGGPEGRGKEGRGKEGRGKEGKGREKRRRKGEVYSDAQLEQGR